MLARLVLCLLLVCAPPAMAQLSKLEVAVKRVDVGDMHVFEVVSSGEVRAAPAAVWKILTNYERMPEFVPDLKTTKVLSRSGNRAVIEQYGTARFLFLRRAIQLVVQATEEPMSAIDINLVSGDMKVYNCRWELVPTETGGTRILYTGKLVPKFYVPGMLGANIIRSDIERMMQAVLERLEKPPE
jgi:ribosome-associated toxin RatA of RatAB toxin-antitoxin module